MLLAGAFFGYLVKEAPLPKVKSDVFSIVARLNPATLHPVVLELRNGNGAMEYVVEVAERRKVVVRDLGGENDYFWFGCGLMFRSG